MDSEDDSFTYMIGVGVDKEDLGVSRRPGTYLHQIKGGLYAVFTTPQAEESRYVQTIRDTWKEILSCWLPNANYEYDSTREEYEYYDERDHGSMAQMDIYIPVRVKNAMK